MTTLDTTVGKPDGSRTKRRKVGNGGRPEERERKIAKENPFQRVLKNLDSACTQILNHSGDPSEQETVEFLLESIKRFCDRHVDEARIDKEARIAPELYKSVAEMGLFGISVDRKYGGAGLSLKATCRVIEALSVADRSLGVSVGLHTGLGLRGLNYFGSEKLKERYLPELAAGKQIACFAVTEAEAGSDLASMTTTALQDGNHLVINGSKVFVTNGGVAGIATIVARTPELMGSRRGHSMILVPLDQPGVSRGAEERKLGIRGSSTRTINFDDVRVPLDYILGTPAQGLSQLNHVLSWGRILMASGCLGLAQTAYRRALTHAVTRTQFGRPICRFGMVQEKVANMRLRNHAMECLLRLVARLEDEQPASVEWETAVAKVFCSEGAWINADDTVQLHGGSGFIEDTGVALLLRDSRISRIFEGANELMRYHMSSIGFTWPVDMIPEAPSLGAVLDPVLRESGAVFDNGLRRLAEAIGRKKKEHGLRIFQRQMEQRCFADALIELYTQMALLVRAQAESQAGRLTEELLNLTRYGVQVLNTSIEHALGDLDFNANDLARQIAVFECERLAGSKA